MLVVVGVKKDEKLGDQAECSRQRKGGSWYIKYEITEGCYFYRTSNNNFLERRQN
jgi:hypothetical protein